MIMQQYFIENCGWLIGMPVLYLEGILCVQKLGTKAHYTWEF